MPKSPRIGRDTPRLYALYSDVFSGHLHTNSVRKPYCRKDFQICIQCIQRIPTPFVFAFSLLLGREYMNTRSGGMMGHGRRFRHDPLPPAVGNAEKHPLSAVLRRVVENSAVMYRTRAYGPIIRRPCPTGALDETFRRCIQRLL